MKNRRSTGAVHNRAAMYMLLASMAAVVAADATAVALTGQVLVLAFAIGPVAVAASLAWVVRRRAAAGGDSLGAAGGQC